MLAHQSITLRNYILINCWVTSPISCILTHMMENVKQLSNMFDAFSLVWCNRRRNVASHTLAKFSLSLSDDAVWLEDLPPYLADIIALEFR